MTAALFRAVALIASVGFATHASAQQPPVDIRDVADAPIPTFELNEITNPDSDFYRNRGTFTSSSAENRLIEQAARGVGVRAGFAAEANRINEIMMSRWRSVMTRKYQFRSLMLQNGYVVPPVITRITNVRELPTSRYLYNAAVSYEIVKEPRLTTLPPSWMDYVLLPIRDVRPPSNISLDTAAEKRIWSNAAEGGWDTGVREARRAFIEAFNVLERDYQGMRLYHAMAKSGHVSIPRVNISRQAVRIDDNGRRRFENESVVQLVAGSQFSLRR